MNVVVRCSLFILLNLLVFTVRAADNNSDWLTARYNTIINHPDTFQQAYNAGRDRATLCGYCHGMDGNSVKDDVPNLAAQNPLYLWTQIDHFANGTRKNFVMQALAKNFSDDDKLNLAIYFSANKVHSQKADSNRVEKGQILYRQNCMACHGESAYGTQKFARLAGQKHIYLVQTLKSFRLAAKNPAGAASMTKRRSKSMEAIAAKLTDEDILDLAAYLSSQS